MLKKSFHVIVFGISLLSLFISYTNRPLRIGVVDLHLIIAKRSGELAKQKATAYEIKKEVQNIQKKMTEFGKKHHLLLFSKGCLLSEAFKDYTDEILS
jgi:hypothetical protein